MSEGLIWIVSKHKRGSGNLNAVRGVARVLGEDMNFQTKEFELDEYLAALNLQYDIIRDSGGTTGRLSNTFGRICDHFSISPRNLQLKINWEANQSLFKTHGCPDIVMTDEMGVPFGNHIAIDSTTTGPLFPWRTYVASHMQYLGWGYYTNYAASNLVPHNLTQELLDEEAKKLNPLGIVIQN